MMQRMHIVISPQHSQWIREWARDEARNVSAQLGWLIKQEAERRGHFTSKSEVTSKSEGQKSDEHSGSTARQAPGLA